MIISPDEFRKFVITEISDKMIQNKLMAIESFIRKYTNNNFQVREIRSRSETLDGKILNPPKFISKGDTVQITDSLLNNGIYVIEDLSYGKADVDGTLLDCTKNIITKILYPADVVIGAVNMLRWDLEKRDKIGIQSEKISRHSVTYTDINDKSVMGYPKILLGFLKPYMKARF